ncbi:MAG: ATP-binding protein, partial [Sweet potato little leaf phytoplasma]|nr:ATP-binding protein [Sweet potato little leaf phytoplasma]
SVSGGVDSKTLLDYLYSRKFQIIVVHFNHLKRERSYQDKVFFSFDLFTKISNGL